MLSLQWELGLVLCGVLHYSDQSDFNTVLGLKISNLCSLLHCPMQWGASLGLSGICSLPQGVWVECHQGRNLFWAQTQISVAAAGAQQRWAQTQNFIPFLWRRRFALSESLYWIPILNSECSFSNDFFFFFLFFLPQLWFLVSATH